MRRLLAALAVASLFAAPMSVAAAEPGATIEVGPAQLIARVVVQVDLTITCDPKPESVWPISTTWSDAWAWVEVRQAVGRQQVSGWADMWFDPDVYCDGLPHTLQATISGDAAYHFKAGRAALQAGVNATYELWNEETWENDWVSVGAQTGWIEVRIGR